MAQRRTIIGTGLISTIANAVLALFEADFVAADAVYAYSTISLSNSWVAHDAGTWATPGAGLGPNGQVVLRGLIKDGTATASTVIGVLPSGRRPPYSQMFHVSAPNSDGADLVISADGNIALFNTVSCNFLSLSGITFTV